MSTDPRAVIDAMLRHVEALSDILTVYQARAEQAEEALAATREEFAELRAVYRARAERAEKERDAARAELAALRAKMGVSDGE